MIDTELKNNVAQNCNKYRSRNPWHFREFSNIVYSCDGCVNYVRGKCTEGRFDEIKDSITMN